MQRRGRCWGHHGGGDPLLVDSLSYCCFWIFVFAMLCSNESHKLLVYQAWAIQCKSSSLGARGHLQGLTTCPSSHTLGLLMRLLLRYVELVYALWTGSMLRHYFSLRDCPISDSQGLCYRKCRCATSHETAPTIYTARHSAHIHNIPNRTVLIRGCVGGFLEVTGMK